MDAKQIVAIDLFCGAGGLTRGLTESGIAVVAGIDTDKKCRYAYEFNNSPAIFIEKDVSLITGEVLNSLWGNTRLRLLAGCAPCQPFSTYSQSKNSEDDSRYPLMSEFARLVRETKPEFVTMENVPAVLKQNIFDSFVRSLRAQGYKCNHQIVKCEEYGVPQRRRRLVLMASRIGDAPKLPEPSVDHKSVRDALHALPPVEAGCISEADPLHRCASLAPINLQRIQASKPGGTWKDWPKEIQLPCHKKKTGSGYTPVYGRLAWEYPSPTITTQCYNFGSGRFGHPDQDRPITMREAALLQGFPELYQFEPKYTMLPIREIARMIGNAVPVGLGKAIGESLLQTLKRS